VQWAVARYLREVDRPSWRGEFMHDALELIRAYERELGTNAQRLRIVRRALEKRDFALTECRLLDIYVWAYWQLAPHAAWHRPASRSNRLWEIAPSPTRYPSACTSWHIGVLIRGDDRLSTRH